VTFRCDRCQGAVWVPEDREPLDTVRCRACGREFDVKGWGSRLSSASLAGEARRLAFAGGMDLPAAYSVALGVLTEDEVRAVPAREARGGRKTAGDSTPTRGAARRARASWVTLAPLLLLLGAGLAILALVSGGSGAARREPRTVAVGAAEVLRDGDGRVFRISAPDPRSVLTAYCRTARAGGRFEPVDLVPAPVDPARTRIGLLRDSAEPDVVLAISIEADTDHWGAGDGRTAIEARRAPAWARDPRAAPWIEATSKPDKPEGLRPTDGR
jgi:hypothetical protein